MKKVTIILISAFALTSIGVFAFATSKTKKTGTTAAETISFTSVNSSNESQKMTYQLVYDANDNCTITRSTAAVDTSVKNRSYFHRSINSMQGEDSIGMDIWFDSLPENYEYYLLKFGNGQEPSIVNLGGGNGGPDATIICDCKTPTCGTVAERDCDVSAIWSGGVLNAICTVKSCCSICKPLKLVKTGSTVCENFNFVVFMARSATMSN